MARRIEAIESRLGLFGETAPERKQEETREDWADRALREIISQPINLTSEAIEALKSKSGKSLLLKERERRFLKSAGRVCQVAYHFLPEVLKERAICPESGLCQRAEEAIKDLPLIIQVTDENLTLWEILGLPAKLRRKKTLKENDLRFLPEIIQGFLKAVTLDWKVNKRGSEEELKAKETKIAEELGFWFLASKLFLEAGSMANVARFLSQKIVRRGKTKRETSSQVISMFRGKPSLPQLVEKFGEVKNFPLPEYGWDQSLASAEALVISGSFELHGRFGIPFKLPKGIPGRKFLIKKIKFPVLESYSQGKRVFISFESLNWLAFLLSQPGKFSAAIDFNSVQKLCFIETAVLLLGHQGKGETLGCDFRKSGKKTELLQEVFEAATSLGFPLPLTMGKDRGELRMPWREFQSLAESGRSPLDWYQLAEAERYFLLTTLFFHSSNLSLPDLKQTLGFTKKHWQGIRYLRGMVIPNFLFPYLSSFYGAIPRKGASQETRKEAISFLAQIFFRRGEKVIWELKRGSPQTPLPELARVFVEVEKKFCDLTQIPIEKIVNWKTSLQPALADWQWILEQGWSLRPNLEAIEEVKREEIDSGRLLNHLKRMGIPRGILEHLKNIAQKGSNQKIINGWISFFIERRGGKRISKVELILFGLALARRATLFSQAVMEYKLLATLGKVPNSTYRKIGFSQRQLANELFEKAARRAQEAKALAILAQMVASKGGLRGDVFLEIEEKLEKINYREKGYLPPEFYPLPLKFMAGREVYLVEGCLSLHRLGEGISTYRNHQWQAEDEEPFLV